jgi:hypothetical protein
MQRHFDDETLTRLAASVDAADAELDEHLARCTTCRQKLRDLRAVRYTLGTLPAPPVPDDLAQTITARFRNTVTKPVAEPVAHSGVQPTGERTSRVPRLGWLTSLAPRHLGIAAAVAVGVGGINMALTGGGSGASSSLPDLRASEVSQTTSAVNNGASTQTVLSASGRDTGNRVLVSSDTSSGSDIGAGTGSTLVLSVTADNYHHTTLGDGANPLFRSGTDISSGAVDAATRAIVMPTGQCLRAVGRTMEYAPATTWRLVGLAVARFDGRPATVLAFVTTTGHDEIAVAVDGTCTGTDPLVLDQAVVRS